MTTVQATLIGDVISSRTVADRAALHERLSGVLEPISRAFDATVPIRITVGDEYQGCFATVGTALQAALRLRLAMREIADVRHGVGWGAVGVLSEEPRVEDGPGWWAAREAIDAVHAAQERPASRSLRTAYRLAKETDGPDPGAVNAALVARDQLLAGAGDSALSVVSAMLTGMSQQEIADQIGVSPSAVSQRVRRGGLAAVVQVDRLLGGVA